MMLAGPMKCFDVQCRPSKDASPLPLLPVNSIKTDFYFHGQQSYGGRVYFSGKRSIRMSKRSCNRGIFFDRRDILGQVYTVIPNERRHLAKIHASSSSTTNTDESKKSSQYSKEKSEDYISRLLREKPSEIEQKFLIGDKFYTSRERENLKASVQKRIKNAFSEFASKLVPIDIQFQERIRNGFSEFTSKLLSKDIKETQQSEEKQHGASSGDIDNEIPSNAVYLKDLLRQYKRELYVPEEAFKFHTSEMGEFNSRLETLPKMHLEDFLKAMRANQIEMLTSRAVQNPEGVYVYRDFIIDLKELPAEKSSQRKNWTIHLSEEEAQAVLGEYSGPQREVERLLTPYIVPPPVMPHPVASSISSRVMIELTMITSVVTAAAFTVGGLLSAMVFAVTGLLAVIAIDFVWPLVFSLLKVVTVLLVSCVEKVWNILVRVVTMGGILGRYPEISVFLASGGSWALLQAAFCIVITIMAMTVIMRFTLARKPKDFRKWDIWQAIEFGQSKPQARVEGSTGVTFKDVAGIDEVVGELQELVRYLRNPEVYSKIGTKAPHGILLTGPPGCGKTLVAKAIAGEAGVPFYQMAGSEFVEVLVGVGAARVRDLFKRAKVNKPSVVFIDEIDAVGAMRQGVSADNNEDNEDNGEEYDAGAQERETTLNQLLIELDGFDTGQGVIFLGATNRSDLLDPALLRPGRFDRKIKVSPPAEKGRLDILKVHANRVKLSPSVDLSVYANNLAGWTGAQLAQLLQEAALVAVRHGHDSIVQSDMNKAVDRLTMGPEREGIEQISPFLWRRATGEVGTALASHLLRRLENARVESCNRISVIPHGDTLARSIFNQLDEDAYIFERRPQLLHRLQVMLGGRAAEEVMYGRNTSTVSLRYLSDASWLARKIISIWNLENPMVIHGEAAPWKRTPGFTGPPLKFEGSLYDDYGFYESPLNYNLENDIVLRTDKLLNDMYQNIFTLIQHYHAALAKAVYVLIEMQEITGDDLDVIIDQYPADTPVHLVEEEENPGSLPPRVGGQQMVPLETSDSSAIYWKKTSHGEEKLSSKSVN